MKKIPFSEFKQAVINHYNAMIIENVLNISTKDNGEDIGEILRPELDTSLALKQSEDLIQLITAWFTNPSGEETSIEEIGELLNLIIDDTRKPS